MKKPSASSGAAAVVLIYLTVFSLSFSSAEATANDFNLSLKNIGLLLNFSVPCDLHSDIAIPTEGGLLTPNLLAVGYQRYMYDGSRWGFASQHATLYNKTLAKVGRLYGGKNGKLTFEFHAGQQEPATTSKATLHAIAIKSVYQRFAIPLQLLNVTGFSENLENYGYADYVQRFGTQNGLAPDNNFPARKAQFFSSGFSAFYAFYLPRDTSPQLASRVPRCGDERFYGLQYADLH